MTPGAGAPADADGGVVERAAPAVAELAGKAAAAAEADRRIGAEVVAALTGAGFARHFVPPRHGGTGGGFAELGRALAVVGEGCVSAAWCGLIHATSGRMAGYLPEEGRDRIWADGPDTVIAAGLVPAGAAERTAGGWRLSGGWQPISAVDHAAWVLLAAPVEGAGPRYFAVPVGELTVRDTWHTLGMRGTGSNTVLADGVHVEDRLSFAHAALFEGRDGPDASPAHRLPLAVAAPPLFAAPLLGAARGALARWTELTAARRGPAGPVTAQPAVQALLGRAAAGVDAAGLLLARALADADRAGGPVPGRVARDSGHAAELLCETVNLLVRGGGSAAQREGEPLQRFWRDVTAAAGHPALDPARGAGLYAAGVWPPA